MLKARADIAAAEAKTQDYEQRLREARLVIFKAQEVRRQAAQKARAAAVAEARERAQQQIREARAAIEQDMACCAPKPAGGIRIFGLRDHPYHPEAGRRSFRSGRSGMKRQTLRRLAFVLSVGLLVCGVVSAQEHAQPAAPPQSESAAQNAQQQPVNPDTAAGQDLTKASESAVHAEEGEVHEENAEFKYSAMVGKLGRMVGIGPEGMYWVSIFINFLVLAVFFWMLLKSKLPQMFRERTNTIQKALKEAHAASAEASRRLGEIEARLSKLDSEVSDIKAGAEREAAAEEERVRAAAEDDKRKVVDAAEAEIAAIARSARHELEELCGFAGR